MVLLFYDSVIDNKLDLVMTIHNVGFLRIGDKKELKFSLKLFWQQKISETQL
jgi:hypothetical protein